jgi:ribosomal protein S18 acetylase RimI-like enzyme
VTYIFRKATEIENEAIYKMYCVVMKGFISEIWGWDEKWQKNDFSTHFNAKEITVVYQRNKLVGYCHVENNNNQLYLRMMVVHPNHQNKEIGTKLLNVFICSGKKQSKSLRLQVFKINIRAKEFYEKHGFVIESENPTSYVMKINA